MGKYLFIVISIMLLLSCQEVFVPDIEEPEPFLLIEGSISTQPGVHEVTLMWSSKFMHNPLFKTINTAEVYVEDDSGNKMYFQNVASGVYQIGPEENFSAEVGKSYILTVETDDGNVFRSQPQTVVPCPEVRNLYCSYTSESILTENIYGEAYEIPFDGIQTYTSTDGILPYNNYYFYKYIGFEQHLTVIRIGINNYYLYGHRRLSGKYGNYLLLGNADEFGDYELRDEKLLFIAKDDMTKYDPPLPDSIEIVTTQFQGLIFRLHQYSLSADAYKFWNNAETQLEAEGRLFDPVSPQLHGNMHCVTDSLTQVIGIFSASDVSEKISYFYIDYRNRAITRDLDSIPELFLDSLHPGRPDDWIVPPY